MKKIHYIYIIGICLVALFASCSSDDGYKYEQQRTAFAASSQLGVYQVGDTLVTFDPLTSQFCCYPDEAVLRVINVETGDHFTLQMDGWPTEEGRVTARVSGTMTSTLSSVTNIYLLKKDSQYAWLWAEDDGIGIVLPSTGF